MISPAILKSLACIVVAVSTVLGMDRGAAAHPHVFVDGGVDFILDEQGQLTVLEVTWRYDLFETLYVLSKLGVSPTSDGIFTEADHAKVVANEAAWPAGFGGAAHLTVAGVPVPLSPPQGMSARLDGDRLNLTFERSLASPVNLQGVVAEVAFYEATYYYAFSVTDAPKATPAADACALSVRPFKASEQVASLQVTLAALGREEVPEIADVGALFADTIVLDCR